MSKKLVKLLSKLGFPAMSIEEKYCVHVQHAASKSDKSSDIHLIKERVKGADGVERPVVRFIKDYQRPFWISNKETQAQHQTKREWEHLDNLNFYECTQAQLSTAISRGLGRYGQNPRLREVLRSPYVYGADITGSVLIKHAEDERNGETYKPNLDMAVLDLETDVLNGTDNIISGSITFKNKAFVLCTEDFIKGVGNPREVVLKKGHEYLGDALKSRNVDIDFKVVKADLDIVNVLFKLAHHYKPDLLAIWNMNFDIGRIIDCVRRHNRCGSCTHRHPMPNTSQLSKFKDEPCSACKTKATNALADLFNAPEVPSEFRRFRYKEDMLVKRMASGKTMTKHPAELWHVVFALASFYVIDAMCTFKLLRAVEANRQSYSLDAILGEEANISKLKFSEADSYTGLAWHRFMQGEFKAEYMIYNVWDCMSMQVLDETTGDLHKALGPYAGVSELSTLRSNPKRLGDAIYFFLLERGKVVCSTSDDMTEEYDSLVLGAKNWVVTVANELAKGVYIPIFEGEDGSIVNRVTSHVADIDITSGYPTSQLVCNISKSTTLVEVSALGNMSENELRRNAVNFTALNTNAVDYAVSVLNAAPLHVLEKEFEKTLL